MGAEELELHSLDGLGPATRQKLTEAGICTILDLVVRGPSDISDVVGVDLNRAAELCNKARTKLVEMERLDRDFVPASEIYAKRMAIDRISTGSANLDELLGGGVETQAVTEFYGEFGSGKTQICHTMCVTVQLGKEAGGLQSSAIYLDTENTFRPERIYSIAESRGLDPHEALQRIIVAKAYNSAHQEIITSELGRVVEKEKAKLIIIDSAVAHYRAEFLGRATLSERQQRLNKFMHLILRIAEAHNTAVVVTNQVQSAPDVFFGDPIKPTGGNVVAHTSTYRIYLRKAGKNRIARMVDSPCHPEREMVFALGQRGIDNPSEETSSNRE